MKKILFSLSALLAFGFAQAQDDTDSNGFSKGDVFFSGTLSYSSQKTDDVKSHTFTAAPAVGYFVTNNIALGVAFGYTNSENSYLSYSNIVSTDDVISAGVFGRYYVNPSNKFNFFAELNVAYVHAKVEQQSTYNYDPMFPQTINYNSNGFGIGLAPGFNYWISNHFALEANIALVNYNSVKPDFDGAESTDSFDIGIDFSNINFGLIYKF
ncbi:outer membrane beta-barrel protein [Flavobacterium rhizosphaerae]|uniref:Outer membrane beta-barrel protein n=1 Tax=Flavobacterium rhizosphaerae TaxID=3163298 RepID=A0ABW8YWG7_9FLAO